MIARRMPAILCFITLIGLMSNASSAEPPNNPVSKTDEETVEYGTRIPVPGIEGAIVLAGRGQVPLDVMESFLGLAGGDNADILVLCNSRPSSSAWILAKVWRLQGASSVKLLSVPTEENDGLGYREAFKSVQGVWIDSAFDLPWGDSRLAESLHAFLNRGGVIGAQKSNAAWLTITADSWGPPNPKFLPRHNARLLPGAVLSELFLRAELLPELFITNAKLRGRFTIGLEENTALIVQGRRASVVGEGDAVFGLGPSKNRPTRIIRKPTGTTVDLIALSRAAVARAGEEFPAKVMRDPVVESGTLFIGGGGQMPEEGMKRFIEASGGPDALIIVIPTALGSSRAPEFGEQNAQRIRNLGANNVIVIHTLNPREADTDEFCEPLRTAGGIWFTGGRQWNLVDAYRGTQAHKLMHNVLKRGGAIGGSSAGASIQAEYMVRGHPLGNTVMMAEGYEKGLDFLPGVGIDQHFAQRDRFADLASVKHAFPQLICLGIDEQTMLIVRGSIVEVVGPNNLQVYAEPVPDDFDGSEYELVKPGQRYNMKLRRKIEESS